MNIPKQNMQTIQERNEPMPTPAVEKTGQKCSVAPGQPRPGGGIVGGNKIK